MRKPNHIDFRRKQRLQTTISSDLRVLKDHRPVLEFQHILYVTINISPRLIYWVPKENLGRWSLLNQDVTKNKKLVAIYSFFAWIIVLFKVSYVRDRTVFVRLCIGYLNFDGKDVWGNEYISSKEGDQLLAIKQSGRINVAVTTLFDRNSLVISKANCV